DNYVSNGNTAASPTETKFPPARKISTILSCVRLSTCNKGAGMDAEQRVKLSKLAWDAIGSEFGGRHELYERNYAGALESVKVETFFAAQAAGDKAAFEHLVQTCLDDYDLQGWTAPTWLGPER